jgi:Ca2+-binding RTX toxin-like protein
MVVHGGTGSLSFVGGVGSSTVFGNGATSIFGAAGGSITFNQQTNGPGDFYAGAGNETLNAALSTQAVSLTGSTLTSATASLVGGSGADTLVSGAGSTTLTGGAGANVFRFLASVDGSTTQATVTDFNASDTVQLIGYGSVAAANALAGATTIGNSTTITLSDNTKITFLGVSAASALTGHITST